MSYLFAAAILVGVQLSEGFHCPAVVSLLRGNHRIGSTTSSMLGMATWSNGQAIKEYQDFLASGKSELTKEDDGPSIIVHSSNPASITPLTSAIMALGNGDDITMTPYDILPQALEGRTSYPIYITLPPYELKQFIQNLNEDWKARSEDFVFFSGTKVCGVVEPILREFGMCRETMTQVVVGFSIERFNRTLCESS